MPRRDDWDPERLPDLEGRRYLITGSNKGLGFFAALQLAGAGAQVVMTGRNPNRLAAARAALLRLVPHATSVTVETLLLDTSNLGSVRAAAATARGRRGLDGLLLNAGVVHPPKTRELTADGHEVVLATNVLGHFSLAGEMLPALAAAGGRMVWLGSMATTLWPFDPADPELEEGYTGWRAYVQSKVMTTALGFEAARRLSAAGVPVGSVVAHPGYAIGGRTRGILGVNEPDRAKRFTDNLQAAFAQSKERGAWPLVRALVDPHVESGSFWGPGAVVRGAPRVARASKITRDTDRAARLWAFCETATRVAWPFDKAARTRRRSRA
ncbi:SDR family NAD(P)-dependent oxidoreductase [Microbacterium sp. zg.Y1090]|uniref:SDR family NAD(P)-dependent oxidoreductase n=1 Tax=Microbacterium TaxID=33882 RepID=UPI00214BA52B|nr:MULTISPECIES: SDR family NAD(P)-dependent oxidoreductase [unclassified Microbacterium]MCR2813210.1 SDR family NAD(P)-dependent oxidoreductase [Microbacterium sp. zg.Y1084]MCR2819523.1 SDR family NAD(P)-dependent oxidoreductase [Microbacterium sp. zg.Y1090]MDL5487377.1 SDR family NAD(P)-dependent oxidoreductase [Microbacterium sp. zg-Y1211]WIM28494.1 SDR family NAD(P)-dependent oxidoreductase [Microbacterium sp. zg-Y1090]